MLGTGKLTFPDISNVRRGGEDGVKGPDRLRGGFAALDAVRASAILHPSGNVSRVCPVEKRTTNLDYFHKIKIPSVPFVTQKHLCNPLRICAYFCSILLQLGGSKAIARER